MGAFSYFVGVVIDDSFLLLSDILLSENITILIHPTIINSRALD